MADSADDIIRHVKAIQAGFEKRAAANTAIAVSMRDLAVARVQHSKNPDDARVALNAYIDGMMHW